MRSFLLLAALLAASTAHAQMPADSGFQFGLGVSRGDLQYSFIDKTATGWQAFAGWRFNRYAALEVGYVDGLDGDGTLNVAGVPATLSVNLNAVTASAIGSVPLGEYFSLFGRLGAARWEAKAKLSTSTVSVRDSVDGTDMLYGGGVAFAWDGAVIRLEYDALDIEEGDVSTISLGVVWML